MQKLVDYLVQVEDRDQRTRNAHLMVELMRQIHPNMKDNQDYSNKLWDDLYIMSGFRLDVDSPFPPPSPESVGRKPRRVNYATHNLRFRHYGRNLELMIEKAVKVEDEMERRAFVSYIAKMMKGFYAAWNKDNVDDNLVFEQLRDMSGGRLAAEIEYIRREGYLDVAPRDRYSSGPPPNGPGNGFNSHRTPNQQQPSRNNQQHRRGGGNQHNHFRNNRNNRKR